ncbi:MAG: lasso RiPP family leader peptide-containing protein [Actinomycetota bacterium]|nr:lasso RiPP family leader peptide-containing protein [Actinomycetota bacterium]
MTEHRGLPEVGGASKLPYGRPTLTDLGSLADVTKGTGPGNDFTDAPTYGTTSIS